MYVHALLSEKILLSKPDVLQITGGSRSWLDELRANGGFPPPVQLGPRRIAWRSVDVLKWLKDLQPAPQPVLCKTPTPMPVDGSPVRRGRGRPRKILASAAI